MTDRQIDSILKACDTVARRVSLIGGEFHGSAFLFDKCMRAFTGTLPAEAVTFSVFINTPVMKPGEATIHNDGRIEMRTV